MFMDLFNKFSVLNKKQVAQKKAQEFWSLIKSDPKFRELYEDKVQELDSLARKNTLDAFVRPMKQKVSDDVIVVTGNDCFVFGFFCIFSNYFDFRKFCWNF